MCLSYAEVPLPEGRLAPFMSTIGFQATWTRKSIAVFYFTYSGSKLTREPSSPDLFRFYVNDLPADILAIAADGSVPLLGEQQVPPLLHAGDVALVSTAIQSLQAQLNKLAAYALKWDLKTKIMQLSGANSNS